MVIKGGIQGQPGNPKDPSDEGVFISKINPGGCASKMDKLKVGQRIIEVNYQSLLGASHTEAVNALRSAGDSIHLLLCDGFNDPADPAGLPAIQNGSGGKNAAEADQPPRPSSSAQEEVSYKSVKPEVDPTICFL